jgi:hypothetical protein
MSALNPVPPPTPPRRVRLPVRDFLIFVGSLGAGVGAYLLLGSCGVLFGQAVVAGCAAFGAVFHFLDTHIQ